MRKFLRRLLGLDKDWEDMYNHFHKVENLLQKEQGDHAYALRDLTIALNELVVKICTDELDPTRQRLSNRLAQEALKKAQAEDWARRHTLGEI
jgi:hypothetical protein